MDDFQVPVIAVFAKYDQFKRNIKMNLEDEGRDSGTDLDIEVERMFNDHYLANLGGTPRFVRLEGEHFLHQVHTHHNFSCRNAQAWSKVF